jgi:predicted Zn finger-like uncharacterized protein
MQIGCPNCQAVYEVPPGALASAARVQCARCDHVWTPADVVEEPPRPAPPPRPTAMSDADFAGNAAPREPLAAPPAERTRPPVAALAAWAASVLLLVGLGWAGLHWHEQVMQAWPASGRLFAALGV